MKHQLQKHAVYVGCSECLEMNQEDNELGEWELSQTVFSNFILHENDILYFIKITIVALNRVIAPNTMFP